MAQWLPIHLLTPHHSASISRTFRAVFPDSILWLDPVDGTGILLGRLQDTGAPLGSEWPGLARSVTTYNLGADQIRGGILLDVDGLWRYSADASLVTDDNQLLQFSQLRSGLRGERAARLVRANLDILTRIARRPPIRLRPQD